MEPCNDSREYQCSEMGILRCDLKITKLYLPCYFYWSLDKLPRKICKLFFIELLWSLYNNYDANVLTILCNVSDNF
ncbi:hypothetical protein T08_3622 [Trichinella sp. T8]|nr:hypothetical protein T08_3622 [Trichinella sp. T8]